MGLPLDRWSQCPSLPITTNIDHVPTLSNIPQMLIEILIFLPSVTLHPLRSLILALPLDRCIRSGTLTDHVKTRWTSLD